MGRLAKRRKKKDAQLRGECRIITLGTPDKDRPPPTYEVSDKDFYGTKEEFEIHRKMALLSPLARARDSMEREISVMLCRPGTERSGWRHKQGNCQRGVAKSRASKAVSSKRKV